MQAKSPNTIRLLRVSIIVATFNRPKDLTLLLSTILTQTYPILEVIIVDDSKTGSAQPIVISKKSLFRSASIELKYVIGGQGLPAARNLGVKVSEGDVLLFLDDDVLLEKGVVEALAEFLERKPLAMAVQPLILPEHRSLDNKGFTKKFEKALQRVFMLTFSEENKFEVRRSGASIFPYPLTNEINVRRLSGCCCYKRMVFNILSFDANLKRWAFMEDLDFSYRVYKRYPRSLYIIPQARVIHSESEEARLPEKLNICMGTIYWFYVFFKDFLKGSMLNLVAFLWALTGNAVACVGGLILKRKPKLEWWNLIYLLGAYAIAFRNLKNILMLQLEFFNKNLDE